MGVGLIVLEQTLGAEIVWIFSLVAVDDGLLIVIVTVAILLSIP